MGNTKSYYIEGELLPEVTKATFIATVHKGFHSTYCVAEIVENVGGYLGVGKNGGPYIVAAIHSYSTVGDQGPIDLCSIFKKFRMHRVDSDWADCWIIIYDVDDTPKLREWRAHCSEWAMTPPIT